MIPITKRLDSSEKAEYICRVLELRKRWAAYENAIRNFCRAIEKEYPLQDCDIEAGLLADKYKKYPYVCKWLVMPFDDIRRIRDIANEKNKYKGDYIKLRESVRHFENIYDSFSGADINNWIIDVSGVKVCPYCNLAYTFNREKKTMG